jgi:CheY-like chemotaxis protein
MRSRVLVVDDKENMLKLFAKILGERGGGHHRR